MNRFIFFAPSIPNEWRLIPNKYLFQSHSSKVGKAYSNYSLLSLTTHGVTIKNINSKGGKLPESFEGYQTVEQGDMIFCLFDLDMSAVFSGLSNYGGMITSAYEVFKVNKDYLTPTYAKYWFEYVFSGRYYKNFSKNIRYTIGSDAFGEIITPCPNLEEQKAIAEFLTKKTSKIDQLISNQEKQIEKLKEYRQAIITKAVTKGLDPNAPMKDSRVEWIGKVPLNWMTPKFKNLATLSNGREIEEDGGDIPVYGSGGIFKYTKRPLFEGTSLLTGRKGTIDNPMLVNGAFWTVDTMFYTSSINLKRVLPEYLFYAFKGCCNFDFYKSGSVLPSMTQSQINNITIPLPALEEQKQILAILQVKMGKIDSLLSLLNRNIEKLNSYKKSLVYEYVTGEKRVSL